MDWQQSDVLGQASPILFGPQQTAEAFDSVTSMFALHYFFASETSLRHLLTTAAANLRPGGYFFGVCPDGARVEVWGPLVHVYRVVLLRNREGLVVGGVARTGRENYQQQHSTSRERHTA